MFLVPGQKAPRSVEGWGVPGVSLSRPTTGSRERRKHCQLGEFFEFLPP